MPAPNNNKTVANANLQYSNMGNFHSVGREKGMAIFKHSREKNKDPVSYTPGYSLLKLFSWHTGIFSHLWNKEIRKRSTLPVTVVAQYQSGLR